MWVQRRFLYFSFSIRRSSFSAMRARYSNISFSFDIIGGHLGLYYGILYVTVFPIGVVIFSSFEVVETSTPFSFIVQPGIFLGRMKLILNFLTLLGIVILKTVVPTSVSSLFQPVHVRSLSAGSAGSGSFIP